MYLHWGVDACLLGMGLKWSVIIDVLVLSGYFPTISSLVNRREFFWCDFNFFWLPDHHGWITAICPSIIFSDIIEWNMKMNITRDVLRTEVIPAPNLHFFVEINGDIMILISYLIAYLWSEYWYSSEFLENRSASL